MRRIALIAAVSLLALGSAALAATLTVKAEMKQVVEPASNTLFAVGGEVDPANGPDQPKAPDARWTEAADAAKALEGVADGLNAKGRAKPGPEWAAFAKQMDEASEAALKAALAKDGAGLSAAANNLSDTCSGCHAKFKMQTAS
jgi:hypothetical protein